MPLVRIFLLEGKTEAYRKALADGVHRTMVEAIEIPAQDRFQVVTEHPAGGLIYDPSYLESSEATILCWCKSLYPPGESPRRSANCTNE